MKNKTIAKTKRELVDEIMSFNYHFNSDAAWCKVVYIESLGSEEYFASKEEHLKISNYRKTVNSLETRNKIREYFLKSMYFWIPDDVPYGSFQNANWQLSKNHEHELTINQIIKDSLEYVQKEQDKNVQQIKKFISQFGLVNLKEMNNSSPEIQREISAYIESKHYNDLGKSECDFEDYTYLKKVFTTQLFDNQKVQFSQKDHTEAMLRWKRLSELIMRSSE